MTYGTQGCLLVCRSGKGRKGEHEVTHGTQGRHRRQLVLQVVCVPRKGWGGRSRVAGRGKGGRGTTRWQARCRAGIRVTDTPSGMGKQSVTAASTTPDPLPPAARSPLPLCPASSSALCMSASAEPPPVSLASSSCSRAAAAALVA